MNPYQPPTTCSTRTGNWGQRFLVLTGVASLVACMVGLFWMGVVLAIYHPFCLALLALLRVVIELSGGRRPAHRLRSEFDSLLSIDRQAVDGWTLPSGERRLR